MTQLTIEHPESANLRQGQNLTGIVSHGEYLFWLDQACSEIIEDGAIRQNTYDFLLVFYSNSGRISYYFSISDVHAVSAVHTEPTLLPSLSHFIPHVAFC